MLAGQTFIVIKITIFLSLVVEKRSIIYIGLFILLYVLEALKIRELIIVKGRSTLLNELLTS